MQRWLILVSILIVGCRPSAPVEHIDELRIISLSPALTGILEDVGLASSIVGRSSWCVLRTREESEVPAVGDLHERNWEAMIRLQPSHVFIQADSTEQDASLLDLSRKYGWSLHAWPLRGVDDIKRVLRELPAALVKKDESPDHSTEVNCRRLLEELDDSMNPSDVGRNRRILIVNDQIPPLSWGQGTYLDGMLDTTGAINVIDQQGWLQLSMEDVVRLEPDLVLVVTADEPDERPALADLEDVSIPDDRFQWLSHPRINYPGPHLSTVFDGMRELLSRH